jgi:hypothetical protein
MKVLLALKLFGSMWGNTVKYYFETSRNLFIHVLGNKSFLQYFYIERGLNCTYNHEKLPHYLNSIKRCFLKILKYSFFRRLP